MLIMTAMVMLSESTLQDEQVEQNRRRHETHIFVEEAPALLKRDDLIKHGRAPAQQSHEVIFVVQQRNLAQLEKELHDVSDPNSANYGRHWTSRQVADLTSNPDGQQAIRAYLLRVGATVTSETLYGDYITATAAVNVWERLFHTEFYVFDHITVASVSAGGSDKYTATATDPGSSHEAHEKQTLLRAERYSIPIELHEHVASVLHTIQLPLRALSTSSIRPLNGADNATLPITSLVGGSPLSPYITPAVLNTYYNIRDNVGGPLATQVIVASLKQYYSPTDLDTFDTFFGITPQSTYVTNKIASSQSDTKCSTTLSSCVETALDLQYLTAVAQGAPTTHWYTDALFAPWLVTVADMATPPLVFSISYGALEKYVSQSEFAVRAPLVACDDFLTD